MTTTSKLEAPLVLRPIQAPDAAAPYITFELGGQSWPSTDELEEGAYPGCNMVPSLMEEDPYVPPSFPRPLIAAEN